MPITYACTCGKTLRVADVHAGRRVKCPVCNTIGNAPTPQVPNAPAPEPEFEVIEDEPAPRVAAPTKPRPTDDEEEVGTYGLDSTDSGDSGGDGASSRDKPLPDFRKGPGQYGKKRRRK